MSEHSGECTCRSCRSERRQRFLFESQLGVLLITIAGGVALLSVMIISASLRAS